jgi:hypothetical protein
MMFLSVPVQINHKIYRMHVAILFRIEAMCFHVSHFIQYNRIIINKFNSIWFSFFKQLEFKN